MRMIVGVSAIAVLSLVGLARSGSPAPTVAAATPTLASASPSVAAAALTSGAPTVSAATLTSGAPPIAYANLDPDDDLVVAPPAPRASCDVELKAAGIRYRAASIPVHETGRKRKITCGAEQVVVYQGGPSKIAYEPAPVLTCTMALALARFDAILQEEATRIYNKPVVRIHQLGTYSCREMANYPGWVSEHSYANAIDLETFVFKDGAKISVLKHFEKSEEAPKNKAGKLLFSVARRAYEENVFSAVLTPYFDTAHRNHFHLDLSRYRADGTRP